MATAIENLKGNVSDLNASVDTLISITVPPPATGVPEADVQAAADSVAAIKVKVDAKVAELGTIIPPAV